MDPIDLCMVILGYAFFSYSSSDQTGGKNNFDMMMSNLLDYEIVTSLRFDCDEIILHFHHWLVSLVLYIICYYSGMKRLCYFWLGGVFQGIINYQDWKEILIVKNS